MWTLISPGNVEAGTKGLRRHRISLSALLVGLVSACGPLGEPVVTDPRQPRECIDPRGADGATFPRIVRYHSEKMSCGDEPCFGVVLESAGGRPTRVFNLTKWHPMLGTRIDTFLRTGDARDPDGFDLAARVWQRHNDPENAEGIDSVPRLRTWVESLPADSHAERLAAPFDMSFEDLLDVKRVSVGVGLNYADHAAEAGGSAEEQQLFFFPKAVVPTGAYGVLEAPDGVELLDYEIELGFVVLDDLDLMNLPDAKTLQSKLAYFLANDVTDRAPMILEGVNGAAQAKSRAGFLPAGPWLVRGSELAAFGGEPRPLTMSLQVDEGEEVAACRQRANTSQMRADPRAVLEGLGRYAAEEGASPPMLVAHDGEMLRLPLVRVEEAGGVRRYVVPRGSVFVTGTPAGVALVRPSRDEQMRILKKAVRSMTWPIRSVFVGEQVAARRAEGYLGSGDRVLATITDLGIQDWSVR
jgi:2-keto-4-pentenoate hydratase/2-oxohepta-3-ene-1,7-dioic acid hydratase in catechol pathway